MYVGASRRLQDLLGRHACILDALIPLGRTCSLWKLTPLGNPRSFERFVLTVASSGRKARRAHRYLLMCTGALSHSRGSTTVHSPEFGVSPASAAQRQRHHGNIRQSALG